MKDKIIKLGGKEWTKGELERVYITSEILNILEEEKGLGISNYGERNNKIYFDIQLNSIMRRYKNKKPQVEIQF